MVQVDEQMYDEINETSGVIAAPVAGHDLLVIEFDQDARLECIEIAAEEANWFAVYIRDHNGGNAVLVRPGPLRLNGDGQLIYEESFAKPIRTIEANKEIAIQNVNAGTAGKNYAVSMKAWERRK